MKSLFNSFLLSFYLIIFVNSRTITFMNSCSFQISVQSSSVGIVCSNLASGTNCIWNIPTTGYNGIFYRQNIAGDSSGFPSATLAEFNLANQNDNSQWSYDWFDISIIPPGCPGTITSYQGCVDYTQRDGYDVGMSIVPLACTDKTRTCLNLNCPDAYGFPNDIKTTSCTNTQGSWQVTFCPAGSYVNLTPAEATGSVSSVSSSPPASTNTPPSSNTPTNTGSSGVCSGTCVIGGFAGNCNSANCPPCWVSNNAGGYSCFDKTGGACPNWSGMVDCTGRLGAQADSNAQVSDAWYNNTAGLLGIGILIGVLCSAIVLVFVAIVYRQSGRVESV